MDSSSSYFEFTIPDTGDEIPSSVVREFVIKSSIHTSYPTGHFILEDPDGRILSELMIRPGSIIQVNQIFLDREEDNVFPFSPMVIVNVQNIDNEDDLQLVLQDQEIDARTGALGGYVRIELVHPWGLFTSWRNQAYTNKTISDIVTDIMNDTSRGFEFSNIDIGETDDDTKGPNRYKLQESEASFIARKLLPYASIDTAAAYSFVNEKNEFFFQSFIYLYNQDDVVSFLPLHQELTQGGEDVPDISGLKNIARIREGHWSVGNYFREQLGAIKKFMYVDDSEGHLSYRLLSEYRSPTPGRTLLKENFVQSAIALASEIHPFRPFEDGVRLARNRDGIMNQFFEIGVETDDCMFEVASVGYPAQLRLVQADVEKPHWANGKWLITQFEHGLKEGRDYSKARLSRPVIDSLPDSLRAEEFYKPGGN